MTALLRSITFFTAIALLLFVGLHAVVPHEHPHAEGAHWSEIPPFSHAENKIVILALFLVALPFLLDLLVRMERTITESISVYYKGARLVSDAIPIRYTEALRKGRIHSRAD